MDRRIIFYALALLAAGTDITQAEIRTWPNGGGACDGDLDTCLETIADGDILEIRSNTPGAQQVLVSGRSFTLRPAPGFVPVFDDSTSIVVVGAEHNVTVVIENLRFADGSISAIQTGAGILNIRLRGNQISSDRRAGDVIRISAGSGGLPHGPVLFELEDNVIQLTSDPQDAVSSIGVCCFKGEGNLGRIRGNRITQFGGHQNGAINLGIGAHEMDIDVIGNVIQGSDFNDGIGLVMFGDFGSVTARIINNIVSGQVNDAGSPAAISLNVSGGNGHFEVINNTVAFNERGIVINGRADLGALITGVAANNIFAFNSGAGINIDQDFHGTFRNDHNLVHGNGGNFFPAGSVTLTDDPRFISDVSLEIGHGSPALHRGRDSALPAEIIHDVFGAPRRNLSVDIGAMEVQGQPPLFSDGFEN